MTVAEYTGEACGGYDSGQYVQERSVEDMMGGGMYRSGMWRERVMGGWYVQERNVKRKIVGSM